jgi:pyruvate formate lyase activating enzyme
MKEASHYMHLADKEVQCELCPNECVIDHGERGTCRVRYNQSGRLFAENYGLVSALHPDPIEKKPLFHFYPGSSILSIGSLGCNMSCEFCQNSEISQVSVADYKWAREYSPYEIIDLAQAIDNNIGIAFTYNEPTVFYEYMLDTAKLAKIAGLKTVMVSNGYISEAALLPLLDYIDAFNIDIKFFTNQSYKKYCNGSLKPVLKVILEIHESGKHLELTNLIIPSLNDNTGIFNKMIDWIYTNLGDNMVLHLTRYFPAHHFDAPPTRRDHLVELYRKAKRWLPYTYLGNINTGNTGDTFCKSCGDPVIRRSGYQVQIIGLDRHGNCKNCREKIIRHH